MNFVSTHPALASEPALDELAYADLVDSIKQRGLERPILLLDDQVIEGRFRLRACSDLGIEPKYLHLTAAEIEDPKAYVRTLRAVESEALARSLPLPADYEARCKFVEIACRIRRDLSILAESLEEGNETRNWARVVAIAAKVDGLLEQSKNLASMP
jgi:ParB-like chromosome segregation protein Spo0J